jgi:hypothetical protein
VLNETWKDQPERLKRSHALFKQVGEQTLLPQEILPGRDVLYHFCCDALHLRDWIAAAIEKPKHRSIKQKEKVMDGIKKKIKDELFTPSRELSACADIANGSKHLILTDRSYMTGQRGKGHAKIKKASATVGVPPIGTTGGYHVDRFEINVDGRNRDAQKVADRAVEVG